MSQQNQNYYAVLGITPTASAEHLRAAYREKVCIVYPDCAVDAATTASLQMVEVVRAWSTLSNPDLRHAYDAEFFDTELFNAKSEAEDSFPPIPSVRCTKPTAGCNLNSLGRLAQSEERHVHIVEVVGSRPISPTRTSV